MSNSNEQITRAAAQEVLNKYDNESKTIQYIGLTAKIITLLAVIWGLFQMYTSSFGIMNAIKLRAFTLGFILIFAFLLFPARKSGNTKRKIPTQWDMICIILSTASISYLILMYDTFVRDWGGFHRSNFNYIFGAIGILMLFEASRRVVGITLTTIAAVFLLYIFAGPYIPGVFGHGGFSVTRVIDLMFWGSNGIFGIPLGVFATYVFMFVLFGAFLKNSGFTDFINDAALAIAGRTVGGPAKVAVIGSAFMGMVNGSPVANVVTTGAVTIPLMKSTGYKPSFAGAVEAVASTGGVFAPPIMGAAGFIMAEFLGVPYTTVLLAAIIPAILYYVTVFMAVHFEAKRMGLSGISKENLPNMLLVIKDKGHLIIPLIVLIAVLASGLTPLYAAVWSLIATVVASWLRKSTRMGLGTIIRSFEEGVQASVIVGVACAIVGIVVGTVTLTSLGLVIGYNILNLAGGSLFLAALFTMIISIVLGIGVPASAAYIIVATISAPLLIELGVPALTAHMFAFFYAALSNITPPHAMASFAASGLSGASPNKVSFTAVRLGITGFIIPFFFLYNSILLFDGENVWHSSYALLTAIIGVIALAGGLQGWLLSKANIVQRIMLFIISFLLIHPYLFTDIIGVCLLLVVIIYQKLKPQKIHLKQGESSKTVI